MIKGWMDESDLDPDCPYDVWEVYRNKEDTRVGFSSSPVPVVVIPEAYWERMEKLLKYAAEEMEIYSIGAVKAVEEALAIMEGRE